MRPWDLIGCWVLGVGSRFNVFVTSAPINTLGARALSCQNISGGRDASRNVSLMNYIRRNTFYVAVCLLAGALASPASAQQTRPAFAASSSVGEGARLELPFEYDGPPPPDLPATVVRDETGGRPSARSA